MIGLDIFCGAPPAPAPAAPPANLIDSSQNIYKSNPLFFDPNAPAPTSATSYYPENPGFVEDPRSLDVNRDFGMTKYAPQWDTPEQAALTGIDAMVGAWRLDSPVNASITNCPICAGRIVERCRCALADGKCENGHEWHRCLVHQRTLQGRADHSLGAERCQCHRSLTIGGEHARRADCPPLTHCTVGTDDPIAVRFSAAERVVDGALGLVPAYLDAQYPAVAATRANRADLDAGYHRGLDTGDDKLREAATASMEALAKDLADNSHPAAAAIAQAYQTGLKQSGLTDAAIKANAAAAKAAGVPANLIDAATRPWAWIIGGLVAALAGGAALLLWAGRR